LSRKVGKERKEGKEGKKGERRGRFENDLFYRAEMRCTHDDCLLFMNTKYFDVANTGDS